MIAATNHEKLIDSALWRRFDEVIYFDKPDISQIDNYINMKLRAFDHNALSIEQYSKELEGLSFADIERVCIQAVKHCIVNCISGIDNNVFKSKIDEELKRHELIKNISC